MPTATSFSPTPRKPPTSMMIGVDLAVAGQHDVADLADIRVIGAVDGRADHLLGADFGRRHFGQRRLVDRAGRGRSVGRRSCGRRPEPRRCIGRRRLVCRRPAGRPVRRREPASAGRRRRPSCPSAGAAGSFAATGRRRLIRRCGRKPACASSCSLVVGATSQRSPSFSAQSSCREFDRDVLLADAEEAADADHHRFDLAVGADDDVVDVADVLGVVAGAVVDVLADDLVAR